MAKRNGTNVSKMPVMDVAKSLPTEDEGKIVTLSTGVKGYIRPVSASLAQAVMDRVKDPVVPMFLNEDKGREEPNPNDPEYLKALQNANDERQKAVMDVMVMFGLELAEPVPEDETWVKKLHFLGIEFDAADPFEREFAYKKYIACGAPDLKLISQRTGVSEAEIAKHAETFQG